MSKLATEDESKRQRKDSSEDESGFMCQKCDYIVAKVLACSRCKLSFFLRCANISKILHQCFLDGELENFHWTCRSCKAMFPSLQNISSTSRTVVSTKIECPILKTGWRTCRN